MGAVTQMRIMGGVIVLSIATSVFNSYTRPRIAEYFRSVNAPIDSLMSLQSLAQFPPEEQTAIRLILSQGYNLQMYILCAFSAAQTLAALLVWRKKQIMV